MKKKNGFYMTVTPEEKDLIRDLREKHAINLSQAFKLFLKDLLLKLETK